MLYDISWVNWRSKEFLHFTGYRDGDCEIVEP